MCYTRAYYAKWVRDVALQLGNQYPKRVDRGILAAAAWFHNIGQPLERVGEIKYHGEWGATEATSLLQSEDVATDRITAIEDSFGPIASG